MGSYADGPAENRTSIAACKQCPGESTTFDIGSSSIEECFCTSDKFYRQKTADGIKCMECPQEANCTGSSNSSQIDYFCPWTLAGKEGLSTNKDGTSNVWETECDDGTFCNEVFEGLDCCDCHGGPKRCAGSMPNMCQGFGCGKDAQGKDRVCCLVEECAKPRDCPPGPFPTPVSCASMSPPPSPYASPPPMQPIGPLPGLAGSGTVTIWSVEQLQAVIKLPSVNHVLLMPDAAPYELHYELYLTRDLIIEGIGHNATLDASADENAPRRVINISENATRNCGTSRSLVVGPQRGPLVLGLQIMARCRWLGAISSTIGGSRVAAYSTTVICS